MEEARKVEMVRVPREEEFYDREEVLGRDAASVFPKEATQAADANREAMVEALGARKFISETELAQIKATRGGAVDDGSVAADKPLAQILAERKAEKDAAFQETWRQMKTGKNRPLDPEEADFFEGLRRLQAEKEAEARQMESTELEAFREAVAAAAAGGGVVGEAPARQGSGGAAAAAAGPAPPASVAAKRQPAVNPVIKVIPKGKRAPPGGPGGGAAAAAAAGGGGGGGAAAASAKRQKTDGRQSSGGSGGEGSGGGEGLAGLLGGYGSGSEDDSS